MGTSNEEDKTLVLDPSKLRREREKKFVKKFEILKCVHNTVS